MRNLSISELIDEFDTNRYMYLLLTIILQSCLGSVAAMLILMNGTNLITGIELTLCVITCMFYNAALLAQLESKYAFWLLVISLIVNSLLVIVNLVF